MTENLFKKFLKKPVICIVGLGYVGLPLACEFSKKFKVLGFDSNKEKISSLKNGIDPTNEIPNIKNYNIEYTIDQSSISKANFIIIAVPTPIDSNNIPDLKYIQSASEIVGKNLSKGSIIIFESTVYPGVTEEIALPIIQKESNLIYGNDFKLGYSPERINPGDKEHTIDKIIKIVSGSDNEALEIINNIYSTIITAGIHKAPSIKVAEAAKVIENIQRDLNIALMNELALIFDKMNIDTQAVIEAASTKWNFHKYTPGLVGGHCIGVDPYYLTYKSQELGYDPKVILAGRKINDNMHKHVIQLVLRGLSKINISPEKSNILIVGLTFKENVNDYRNSRVKYLIQELKKLGADVEGEDPLLNTQIIENEFNIKEKSKEKYDAIILFSLHDQFNLQTIKTLSNVIVDIKGKIKPTDSMNYYRL